MSKAIFQVCFYYFTLGIIKTLEKDDIMRNIMRSTVEIPLNFKPIYHSNI